jgi:preprotein translocase subunit SecA
MLIGTASVEKSEVLSKELRRAGVKHEVLNAKEHAREAAIIAQAGRKGAVVVATNMAGRGTDIILGGNPEFLADQFLQKKGIDPVDNPDEYEAQWPGVLADIEEQVAGEHNEVVDLGGLYVIGSERHESRRIDNQLRGRSGRQGDPGESRFYLSLEDDLMRRFNADTIDWVLSFLKVPDDVPIENKRVSKSVQSAQEQVESMHFESRKNVLKYDDVMNRQRHAIYTDRRRVLEGADVSNQLRETTNSVVGAYVASFTEGFIEEWDFEALWTQMRTLYPVKLKRSDYAKRTDLTSEELVEDFQRDVQEAYDAREAELGEENMREFERQVMLTVLDRKWREHLYEMDYLREGIGLRAMAQRDPLVEYQREGGDMFNSMMEAFMEEVVGYLFNLQVRVTQAPDVRQEAEVESVAAIADRAAARASKRQNKKKAGKDAASASAPTTDSITSTAAAALSPVAPGLGSPRLNPEALSYSSPDEAGNASRQVKNTDPFSKVGRNDPCPCGSGKKYKLCHGRAK